MVKPINKGLGRPAPHRLTNGYTMHEKNVCMKLVGIKVLSNHVTAST